MPWPRIIPFSIKYIHLGRCASAGRNHLVGRDSGEGPVDDLCDEMPDHKPGCHRCGKFAVDNTPLGGFQLDGSCATIIIRDIRTEHAFHGHKDISVSKVENNIATPIHLG